MKPGSIEDTIARLTIWCKRTDRGLARVEFDSEFARMRVVNGLWLSLVEAGVLFHEITLPTNAPVSRLVKDLVDQLSSLPAGVVSISGFAVAFSDGPSVEDSLQVLNFNRENLARPLLRQIWWMPAHFVDAFVRAVPDLDSWFMVRLHLTEEVKPPSEAQVIIKRPDRATVNLEDARKRAKDLVARLETALEAGMSATELRRSLAIPAINALREAGAEKEARELGIALAQKIAAAIKGPDEVEPLTDFFISYTQADRPWAEWIAWELENVSYTTKLQAWDFLPGSNFVLEMQEAVTQSARIIAILSPQYLSSAFAAPEWAAAFATDPTGVNRTLVPVRVAPCEPTGLLKSIVYIDLVGLDETAAREKLIGGLEASRVKPTTPPVFPGKVVSARPSVTDKPEFPGTLPPFWNVPFSRNPFFTGREEILKQLRDALTSSGTAALGQPQAISGLGGVGKTQTAVEYAYRHRDEYKAVLWTQADSREALISGFVALAGLLNLPEKDEKDQNLAVAAVRRWLEGNADWLLVLDNAEDLALPREFLPIGVKGHVLLTTRARAVGAMGRVEVEEMPPEEGALFLLRRARIVAGDAGPDAASGADRAKAVEISKEVDGLPLALDQAGAFIEETPSTLAEYLDLYKTEGAKLRAKRGDLATDHPESVAVTFSLSFAKVATASPAAADLLRLCAFLHSDAIPEEILTEGAPDLGDVLGPVTANPLLLIEAIREACRFSLLRRDPEARTLSIHRLVQAVLKDEMDQATQRRWAERAVRAVNQAFPAVEFPQWPLCERLLPHAQICAELVERWGLELQEAARLLNGVGYYLHERARFAKAEPLFRRSLIIAEKACGPDHSNVATSLNNLAELYRGQGKYDEAGPLYRRSLAIAEKNFGPDHFSVATYLNNLAGLYHIQNKYAEAELLFKRSLAILEKELGPDHPNVAICLSNLGTLYEDQGKHVQAEAFYQRARSIMESAREPNHPDVATSLNNLAGVYLALGRTEEAERFYKQAKEIWEKSLRPDHPQVAGSLNNLGVLYQSQGQLDKAESHHRRSLEIRQKVLGLNHPDVATSLNNLAGVYDAQKKYAEAEELYRQALEVRKKRLGRIIHRWPIL